MGIVLGNGKTTISGGKTIYFGSPSIKTLLLRPSGPGLSSGLLSSSGNPNWMNVDEIIFNGDYNGSGGLTDIDLYALPTRNFTTEIIQSISIISVCIGDRSYYDGYVRVTAYDGTASFICNLATTSSFGNTWQYLNSGVMLNNPRTGLLWTVAEANALQIGNTIDNYPYDGNGYVWGAVGQIYVEIKYH